jgi:hypothetical protein
MNGACSNCGLDEKFIQGFDGDLKERAHLEGLGTDGENNISEH